MGIFQLVAETTEEVAIYPPKMSPLQLNNHQYQLSRAMEMKVGAKRKRLSRSFKKLDKAVSHLLLAQLSNFCPIPAGRLEVEVSSLDGVKDQTQLSGDLIGYSPQTLSVSAAKHTVQA